MPSNVLELSFLMGNSAELFFRGGRLLGDKSDDVITLLAASNSASSAKDFIGNWKLDTSCIFYYCSQLKECRFCFLVSCFMPLSFVFVLSIDDVVDLTLL